MGKNPDPLPDECDFCGAAVGEHDAIDAELGRETEPEELVPVWVGEPPEPRPESVQRVVDKGGPPRVSPGGGPITAGAEPFVLGKEASEWSALFGALEAHPWVEASTAPVVAEVEAAFAAPGEPAEPPSVERRRDKAGATVRVRPEYAHREPDLLVCEHCREAFSP